MVSDPLYIDFSPSKLLLQVRHLDREHILLTEEHSFWAMDHSQKIVLNPFNFFEWKDEMEILLREKCIYRVTMETKAEPNVAAEKI